MKRHLKEIEIAGMVMLFLGVAVAHTANMQLGAMIAAVGIVLWLLTVVVKATDWKRYRHDNMVNFFIMLGTIIMLFITILHITK